MTLELLLGMVMAALAGTVLYTILGIIPGTDETAVIAPVTLALVLLGIEPIFVFTFFMAAIIAHKVTDSVPVAVAGIPGGVMAAPMVEHAVQFKKHGQADLSIRKMASGSVVGTLVAVPISFLFAWVLMPVADWVQNYAGPLFFFGTIILALLAKNRLVSLVAIIPFMLLVQGLRHLYWATGVVPEGRNVFTSFFLGITIGPVIVTLLELMNKDKRERMNRFPQRIISLTKQKRKMGMPNPFTILTIKETILSGLASLIGSITFILSAVGTTTLIGELFSNFEQDRLKKSSLAIACMEALANATYISGILIPLIAFGIPFSSVSLGPGLPLFQAPPVFDENYNMHHALTIQEIFISTLVGAGIALFITYYLVVKYSREISAFVFKWIPHEAIIGLFVGLVFLLGYIDAGWINIAGVLLVSIVAGSLHRLGVSFGVLFMALYSAPWFMTLFG